MNHCLSYKHVYTTCQCVCCSVEGGYCITRVSVCVAVWKGILYNMCQCMCCSVEGDIEHLAADLEDTQPPIFQQCVTANTDQVRSCSDW